VKVFDFDQIPDAHRLMESMRPTADRGRFRNAELARNRFRELKTAPENQTNNLTGRKLNI
jgi:hypothetical protein